MTDTDSKQRTSKKMKYARFKMFAASCNIKMLTLLHIVLENMIYVWMRMLRN
jgi:hypothetical protein